MEIQKAYFRDALPIEDVSDLYRKDMSNRSSPGMSTPLANIATIRDIRRQDSKDIQVKWNAAMETEIQNCIRSAMSSISGDNAFDKLTDLFQAFYDRPCSNVAQLSKRTKQQSGLLWEHFCLMYLREKGYGKAWLIGDAPDEVLEQANLTRRDMGIDIIIMHENGYMAVQCKWRSNPHKKPKTSITWNQLSTFYALCARSGPWLKYIVMTNCDYVRRVGKKYSKDQTISKAAFRSQPREVWQKIGGLGEGHCLSDFKQASLTKEEVREQRLRALTGCSKKEDQIQTKTSIVKINVPMKFRLKK